MKTCFLKPSLPFVLSAFALGACQAPVTQEQSGMVIGGLLGGAVGSQFGQGSGRTAAVILGTLTGVAVGGAVGRSMAERDRYMTAQTLETVRTGVPSSSAQTASVTGISTPAARAASLISVPARWRGQAMPVGWNWKLSASRIRAPAR